MKQLFNSSSFKLSLENIGDNYVVFPYRCKKQAMSPACGYIAYQNRVQLTCNPYYGCLFNCQYCYVPKSFSFKHGTLAASTWGRWIIPKINFPQLLIRELKSLQNKQVLEQTTIRLSSISDPFPIIEKEYGLTRECLMAFTQYTPKWVFIQTKSTSILDYLDLLTKIKDHIAIGITVTTDDEDIATKFEPNAPTIKKRLECLKEFKDHGFYTQAIIAPLLPNNTEYFASILDEKVDRIVIKNFYDDGKMGRNMRIQARNLIKKLDLDYLLEKEYYEIVIKKFKKVLGSQKVGVGMEDFIKFPDN